MLLTNAEHFARCLQQYGLRGLPAFVRYSLGARELYIPGAGHPIRLRRGTTDNQVFAQIFLKRSYDCGRLDFNARLDAAYNAMLGAGETPLIVDAGANIGLASVWYAHKYPGAVIYAVEPDDGNFLMLRENTRHYPNIVPLKAAVWDHCTTVGISNSDAEGWAFQVAECRGDVPAYAMPEIIEMAGSKRIFIAKIDIEGSERELFRSNTDWLDATDCIAIELHDWMTSGCSRSFLAEISRRSFDVVCRGETIFGFRPQA